MKETDEVLLEIYEREWKSLMNKVNEVEEYIVQTRARIKNKAAEQSVQPTLLTVCPKCGGWLKGGECENCTLP